MVTSNSARLLTPARPQVNVANTLIQFTFVTSLLMVLWPAIHKKLVPIRYVAWIPAILLGLVLFFEYFDALTLVKDNPRVAMYLDDNTPFLERFGMPHQQSQELVHGTTAHLSHLPNHLAGSICTLQDL